MSTVVARRVLASPARLSSAAWQTITGLIAREDEDAIAEFSKVKGLCSSLINDEVLKEHPLVVKNSGPRLRVYCIYGEEAISGEDKNEEALSWSPTAESWHAFLPCLPGEIEEMSKLLAKQSKKFSLYDFEKGLPDYELAAETTARAEKTTVNWGNFGNL